MQHRMFKHTGAARYLDIAGDPLGALDGQLIYVSPAEGLFAVPFAGGDAGVSGAPVRLPEQIPLSYGLARASLSRNGSLVYATSSALGQLVLLDSRGNAEPLLRESNNYSFPRFSPDGKRIAVSIGSQKSTDVWIYDIASHTSTRLTTDGSRSDRAEWTPDGKRVLYSTVGRDQTALWWRNVDLSGVPELLESAKGAQVLEGTLTPDGGTLIFRSTSPARVGDIWYRRLSGDTTRKPVATSAAVEYAPRLSPDGRWIAYSSNQDGASQVYIQPFPPSGAHYQVTDVGGTTPVWSPDGRRIYYVSNSRLFAATVRTTPDFAVLARTAVAGSEGYNLTAPVHANYDVSPDGRNLLLVRPTQGEAGVVVVYDWKRELRARVRGGAGR